nr:zinc finger protein RFP-like isoform X2 [Pogona vitticeps]XP_020665727.1 zinc finger protein RFP-like isoform X2 [Pogona vitticeps]XP_020665728.1 zinc finger protein RFP-like isoform X2 [Pogona vitticeps]
MVQGSGSGPSRHPPPRKRKEKRRHISPPEHVPRRKRYYDLISVHSRRTRRRKRYYYLEHHQDFAEPSHRKRRHYYLYCPYYLYYITCITALYLYYEERRHHSKHIHLAQAHSLSGSARKRHTSVSDTPIPRKRAKKTKHVSVQVSATRLFPNHPSSPHPNRSCDSHPASLSPAPAAFASPSHVLMSRDLLQRIPLPASQSGSSRKPRGVQGSCNTQACLSPPPSAAAATAAPSLPSSCFPAMASESPLETLQREITCSICLSYFKEPVSIDCGHNFCQACITQCWGRSDDENTSCPQCRRWSRKRSFRPNRELGNVVEVAKRLRLEAATSLAGQRLCEKHQEPLKLFCEEDETPVCVICRESRAHKAHPMLPIEEAAQDYKKQVASHVKALKKRREKLKESIEDLECRSQADQDDVQTEKQKLEAEFNQIHEFLEKIEHFLIIMLKKFDKEIVQKRDGVATKLSKEINRLDALITEAEEKCQQPASEFLQDIRSILSRCKEGQLYRLVEVSSSPTELEKKLGHFSLKNIVIKEALEKCRETVVSELAKARSMETSAKKVSITLDSNTAHPLFVGLLLRMHFSCHEWKRLLPMELKVRIQAKDHQL